MHDESKGFKPPFLPLMDYLEIINPETPEERRGKLKQELLDYCQLDTFAMVRLAKSFGNKRNTLKQSISNADPETDLYKYRHGYTFLYTHKRSGRDFL